MKGCDFQKDYNYEVLWLFKGFVLWKGATLRKEEGKNGMVMNYICLVMFMNLFMNNSCGKYCVSSWVNTMDINVNSKHGACEILISTLSIMAKIWYQSIKHGDIKISIFHHG